MGFSMSTTVSHTASYEIAKSYSSTFSTTTTQSSALTFPPGQIWQWHFNVRFGHTWTTRQRCRHASRSGSSLHPARAQVTDVCGDTQVLGHDWVHTNNSLEEPCCPPGFASDPTNHHG